MSGACHNAKGNSTTEDIPQANLDDGNREPEKGKEGEALKKDDN